MNYFKISSKSTLEKLYKNVIKGCDDFTSIIKKRRNVPVCLLLFYCCIVHLCIMHLLSTVLTWSLMLKRFLISVGLSGLNKS